MKTPYENVKVSKGCWLWQGAQNSAGYGVMRWRGRPTLVHRIAYEIEHGEIGAGLCVMHSCDRPLCCNPAHLSAGTPRDNMRDSIARGRWKRKRLANGRFAASHS